MNFEESKQHIPSSLMELYLSTLTCDTAVAWQRLCDCIQGRRESLIGKQKQRNDALGKLLESQKGFITIAEKIKQTPKSHVTELLNFTFEEGFRYAVMSLDKIEYEAYEKICRDIDLEWEALKVFSEQVLEHIKQAGEKQL